MIVHEVIQVTEVEGERVVQAAKSFEEGLKWLKEQKYMIDEMVGHQVPDEQIPSCHLQTWVV